MARGRARASRPAIGRGRGTGSRNRNGRIKNEVPEEFREMLQELGDENEAQSVERTPKRRRINPNQSSLIKDEPAELDPSSEDEQQAFDVASADEKAPLQTINDYLEDSSEDEFEWEEVDITDQTAATSSIVPKDNSKDDVLSIVIGGEISISKLPTRRRMRRPPTTAEKLVRLDTHKLHVLCLLFHGNIRNHWCNSVNLQQSLRRAIGVSAKLIDQLHVPNTAIQLQRSKALKQALQKLGEMWRAAFTVTDRGLHRLDWETAGKVIPPQNELETFLDRREFRESATLLRGSADYGAQLFCALLRGLGLQTRLIFSIQPLPINTGKIRPPVDQIPDMNTIRAVHTDEEEEAHAQDEMNQTPLRPQRIRRMGGGQGSTAAPRAAQTPRQRTKREIRRPFDPVFWVEVFDEAYQSWIPIDTMSNEYNFAKTSRFDPGQGSAENLMTYVLAFEEDGIVRDVTRRYAQAYVAKTRKDRVESTPGGEKWLKRALGPFTRAKKLDRDRIEDSFLLKRQLSEGMPRNIEDFRGHPVYALERHLYRDQVIHPMKEIGKLPAPKSFYTSPNTKNSAQEKVYRREDVHNVKSADKWFRLGRTLKDNVEPLKHVKARRKREVVEDEEMNDPENDQTIAMYALFQTELYIPPAVQDGRIPKNVFGNIDVYVRSMIPAGAVHVKSTYARQAARLLSINYAEAVTGFKFQGRHGTAIIEGVIVSVEHRDAMIATLDGIAYQREIEEAAERTAHALAMWRRFILGLRVIERVDAYRQDDEEPVDDDEVIRREIDQEMQKYEHDEDNGFVAGSMLPDTSDYEVIESEHTLPPPAPISLPRLDTNEINNLFEEPEQGGFLRDSPSYEHAEHDDGGGFIVEDDNQDTIMADNETDMGGGFIVQDEGETMPVPSTNKIQLNHRTKLADEEIAEPPKEDGVVEVLKDTPPSSMHSEHSLLSHDPEDDDIDEDWLD